MQDALRAALRTAGYAVLAIAIAHCGDNGNNDNGGGPTHTATPTSAVTPHTATPTSQVSPTSPTETPTGEASPPTATPTPGTSALCPTGISFLSDANTARLDSGWTGFGQNARIVDRGEISVATDCGGNQRPCGVCNLTGPTANPDVNQGVSNNHRCSSDTSIECTSNADCTAGGANNGTCEWFFGAPLPLVAGGSFTCIINQVIGTITGTANIETGEGTTFVKLQSTVFTGPALDMPCPICVGDTTPGDGKRDGTCAPSNDVGIHDGAPCDVSGASPTFGDKGLTSYDCPPALAGGGLGRLPINLATTTSTVTKTLAADSPNCSSGSATGKKCMCDTCDNPASTPCFVNSDCGKACAGGTNTRQPCTTDADCPGGGTCRGGTTCGGLRCVGGTNNGAPCTTPGAGGDCPSGSCGFTPNAGSGTAPNQCNDGQCSPISAGSNIGECGGGPSDQVCGPHDTFRTGCASDTDCPFPGDTCAARLRPCYLDNGTIGGSDTATGAAEVPVNGISHPTLASLFCIAQTKSTAVNTAAGLPGLGRVQLTGTAEEIPRLQ